MRRFCHILAVLLAACSPLPADTAKQSLAEARAASVFVKAGDSAGSGVLVKNGDRTFVWTAAHVLEDLQQVRTVVDPDSGLPKVEVTYPDVKVTVDVVKGGRKVGEETRAARVLRYDTANDLGLLLVTDRGWGAGSARFAAGEPEVGAAVWHVGSFRGAKGRGSVSDGVVSAVGRLTKGPRGGDSPDVVSDQFSLVAHQGSSGGGVFSKDTGECLGLINEFLDLHPRFGFSYGALLAVPARRIREYAKAAKVEYAADPSVKVPADPFVEGSVTTTPVPIPKDFPVASPAPPKTKSVRVCLSLLMPTRSLEWLFAWMTVDVVP
jgi:hypothetical protein